MNFFGSVGEWCVLIGFQSWMKEKKIVFFDIWTQPGGWKFTRCHKGRRDIIRWIKKLVHSPHFRYFLNPDLIHKNISHCV